MTHAEERAGERERKLAEAIIKVRAGEMTARAAARSLSISAKTYYKWEKRALQGLMGALREQPGGRQGPPRDPEKEELKRERDRWRREALIWEERNRIREALDKPLGAKKKGRGRERDGHPHGDAETTDGSAIPGPIAPPGASLPNVHEVAGKDREGGGSGPSSRPPASSAGSGAGGNPCPGDRPSPLRKGEDGGDGGAVPKVEGAGLAQGDRKPGEGAPPGGSAEEKTGAESRPVGDAEGGMGDG